MKTLKYNPGRFSDLFEKELSKKIWSFLTSPLAIDHLKLATRLGHPAVVGIDQEILDLYGEVVRERRIKQMVGHMIKQILLAHGYSVHTGGARCPKSPVFSSGTRYFVQNN